MSTTHVVKRIDDASLQKKLKFEPHEGQKKIIESDARVKVLCCGTRYGKSHVAAYLAIRELLKTDKRIWICAPTFDLGGKVFAHAEKMLADGFPGLIQGIKRRPNPRIETPWRSWLEVKSGINPEGMLGEEIDLAIVDEASRIKKDVWTGYIFSRLGTRKGKAILISTPFGKNWFYEEFQKAKKENAAFHYETRDNPHYPEGEWEWAKNNLPEIVFNQDFRAQFLDNAATVFRNVRSVVGDTLADYDPNGYYSMGVDLAKTVDYSVIVVVNQANNEVVYFDRFKDISWPLQKERIKAVAKRYSARVQLDSTGLGDPISDDLKADGVMVDDFKFSNTSKHNLINKLSIMIEQERIRIPDEEILIDELEAFGMNRNEQTGTIRYGAPEGLHDDAVIALGLAVWPLSLEGNIEYNKIVEDEVFNPHELFSI